MYHAQRSMPPCSAQLLSMHSCLPLVPIVLWSDRNQYVNGLKSTKDAFTTGLYPRFLETELCLGMQLMTLLVWNIFLVHSFTWEPQKCQWDKVYKGFAAQIGTRTYIVYRYRYEAEDSM